MEVPLFVWRAGALNEVFVIFDAQIGAAGRAEDAHW
jgi:hypothetical protein